MGYVKTLAEARPLLRPGWHLLGWRPDRPGFFGRLNRRIGRGEYTHFEVVCLGDVGARALVAIGAIKFDGIREASLEAIVAEPGGHWDVFEVTPPDYIEYDGDAASAYMRSQLGQPYGWWSLITATARMCLFIRVAIPADLNDLKVTIGDKFCSQINSVAMAIGGLDPVPNCAHRQTGPNDLARSAVLRKVFTLKPEVLKCYGD